MNAYELADELDACFTKADWEYVNDAVNMLRQQADRIAELENQLDKCSHHEAMAHQGGYELGKALQLKELSDEEILEFRDKVPYTLGSDLIEFARAILKKASEK